MNKSTSLISLNSLPQAKRIPKVSGTWSVVCWLVFLFSVGVVLTSLATLGGFGPERTEVKLWLFTVLVMAFSLSAFNTFLAANAFGNRQRDLKKWITERIKWRSGEDGKSAQNKASLETTDSGSIHLVPGGEDPLQISLTGKYCPREYQGSGNKEWLTFPLAVYMEHLQNETHAARSSCAKLAAALGGVFVAAIQTYGKLY